MKTFLLTLLAALTLSACGTALPSAPGAEPRIELDLYCDWVVNDGIASKSCYTAPRM